MSDQNGELPDPAQGQLVSPREAEEIGYMLMRRRFASVRHEILHKISDIHHTLALTEGYLKRETASPEHRDHLQRLLRDALHSLGDVRRIMRFDLGTEAARVDAMMVPWLTMIQQQEPAQVAILPWLHAILFGLRPKLASKGLVVNITSEPDARILSHGECFSLILRVLLDTAVNGAATQSNLEIVWKRHERMGSLSIVTTGSKISRADESRMFAFATGAPENFDEQLHERYQARSIAQVLGYEIAFQQRSIAEDGLSQRVLKLMIPASLVSGKAATA